MSGSGRIAISSIFLPAPDLLDFAIILLLSIAINLAILALGTQWAGRESFTSLPPWMISAFSSIWTAVASGAAGIGLAVVKALSDKEKPKPNYALYVLLTSAVTFAAIELVSNSSGSVTDPVLPKGITVIDTGSSGAKPIEFDLSPPPGPTPVIDFEMQGTYSVHNGQITGHLSSSDLRTFEIKYPLRLTHIAVALCYIHKVVPASFPGQKIFDMFPGVPKAQNSAVIDLATLEANKAYKLPAVDFHFAVPQDFIPGKGGLCGGLYNDGGGYFPAF